MGNAYSRAIASLRLVPRVEGSFVLNEAGVVLAADLRRVTDTGLLQAVGTKLLVLGEAMGLRDDACVQFELHYPRFTLFGCRLRAGILCVLAETAVIAEELNMALAAVGPELSSIQD